MTRPPRWGMYPNPYQGVFPYPPPYQPPPGADAAAYDAWYRGQYLPPPEPQDWPQPPTPGAPPAAPAEGGVGPAFFDPRLRKTKGDWRPLESELARWGGEQSIIIAAAQNPNTVALGPEVARIELPFPQPIGALVWARLATAAPAVAQPTMVQLFGGGGSLSVPVTPEVVLASDGIARYLGSNDARTPAVLLSFPLPMPLRTLYVRARFDPNGPIPAVETKMIVGAILGPLSSIW